MVEFQKAAPERKKPPSKPVKLHLAGSGHDLWPAIEAAQYACVIEKIAPHTKDERARMEGFSRHFRECAKEWGGKSPEEQAWALEQLGSLILALRNMDLYVYFAVVQKRIRTAKGRPPAEMPVAILAIVRDSKASITVEVPEEEVG